MQHDLPARDLATLRDILHSARLIQRRMIGKSLDDIMHDEDFQDLIVLRLLFIGEAAKRISVNVLALTSEVPWPEIRGMRNRIIHGYDSIDYSIVWDTVQNDIPPLLSACERVLRDRGHEQP